MCSSVLVAMAGSSGSQTREGPPCSCAEYTGTTLDLVFTTTFCILDLVLTRPVSLCSLVANLACYGVMALLKSWRTAPNAEPEASQLTVNPLEKSL